jgi:hypothetical protein
MNKTFTLRDLSEPTNELGSTLTLGVSMKLGTAKTFSLPPYLYYALKAKTLSAFGVSNEAQTKAEGFLDVSTAITQDIRNIAKQTYHDLDLHNITLTNYISTAIQGKILQRILGEPEPKITDYKKNQAISINATRSKKNITIPWYLMQKLTQALGSEKSARLMVHQLAFQVKETLEEKGALNERGSLTGDAANASWSRKVHNLLFMHIIELSKIKELSNTPCIFDVSLTREANLETITRNKLS